MEQLSWTTLSMALAAIFLGAYVFIANRSRKLYPLPFHLLIFYLSLRVIYRYFEPLNWIQIWHKWIDLGFVVLLSWAVARLALAVLLEIPLNYLKKTALPAITRDFILLVSYAIIFFIVLRVYGEVNLAGIITTSAALTVVLGLAAQTTMGSFFSGLALQIEHPFGIGDWIKYQEHVGRVVGVSWKSTRILTRENVLVFIPNAEISNNTIYVYTKPNPRVLARLKIGVDYGAAPNKVRRVLLDTVKQHPKVLKIPRPEVRLIEFGDFAITYELLFSHMSFANEPRLKAEINNQIWYELRRHNIKIPFPIREVQHAHIERRHATQTRKELERELINILAAVPILGALADEDRQWIAHNACIEDFGENEFIVHQGDPGDSLYIILAGRCEVLLIGKDGNDLQVATLERGNFFGEMSLLTGQPRTASVRVDQDASALKINKDIFSSVILGNPKICEEIGSIVSQRQLSLDETSGKIKEIQVSPQSIIRRIKAFFGISKTPAITPEVFD